MTLAAALRIDDDWRPRPQRGSHRHTVGARPVDQQAWLAKREHDDALIELSRQILDREGVRAFAARPGTEEAGRAVLALVQEQRDRQRTPTPDPHKQDPYEHPPGHPLDVAGRIVAEDLCLVDISGPEPVLVAGSVAMPSGWSIDDKLGRTMLQVHGPVPDYAEQIGTASDQLMRKLAGDRIVARINWTMQAGDALFRPPGTHQPALHQAADVGALAHLRVEYQTLRAVTEDTVLFTIRTAMQPLDALTGRPPLLQDLRKSLDQLPPEQREYKGVATIADPVLTWLNRHVLT